VVWYGIYLQGKLKFKIQYHSYCYGMDSVYGYESLYYGVCSAIVRDCAHTGVLKL